LLRHDRLFLCHQHAPAKKSLLSGQNGFDCKGVTGRAPREMPWGGRDALTVWDLILSDPGLNTAQDLCKRALFEWKGRESRGRYSPFG
jgi:hypothetical protein